VGVGGWTGVGSRKLEEKLEAGRKKLLQRDPVPAVRAAGTLNLWLRFRSRS